MILISTLKIIFVLVDVNFFIGKNIRDQLKQTCDTGFYSWTAPLFFPFSYVNDLPQSLSAAASYLYVNGTSVFYQQDVKKTKMFQIKSFCHYASWP